jgi:hypothetical protein
MILRTKHADQGWDIVTTNHEIIRGIKQITPEIAHDLSEALGTSPDFSATETLRERRGVNFSRLQEIRWFTRPKIVNSDCAPWLS